MVRWCDAPRPKAMLIITDIDVPFQFGENPASAREITVIVAERHPLVRTGLVAVLSTAPEFKVIGAAENGRVALEMAERLQPDVLMASINLPEINGLEAARSLASKG